MACKKASFFLETNEYIDQTCLFSNNDTKTRLYNNLITFRQQKYTKQNI